MPSSSSPSRLRIFESFSGRRRRERAAAFLAEVPPGAEAVVVAPTREVADDLVRRHAPQGTFGVHRYGFQQLVATIAASELAAAGLTPATSLGREAVAARATFDALERGELPRLAEVAQAPGFPGALASTLDELRLSGLDAAPLGSLGASVSELQALAQEFEQEIERAHLADLASMLRLATWAWRRPHWASLREAPIVLLDLSLPTKREREFIESIVRSSPAALATVPAGDRSTLAALRSAGAEVEEEPGGEDGGDRLHRLGKWLFSEGDPPEEDDDADASVQFLSAPGEGRECVEIARRVRDQAAAGVPFDEMAVFLRSPETYSAHLETAFRRAGIPAWFSRGTRRPDPAGRAFLALLACRAENLSAKRFAEYLSFAQVPDLDDSGQPPPEPDDDAWTAPAAEELGPSSAAAQLSLFAAPPESPAPPPPLPDRTTAAYQGTFFAPWKWEELLVEAAVIGENRDRWQRRLKGLDAEYRKRLDELAAHDPESPRVERLQRDLDNLRHLEGFALPVIDALAALPERAAWRDWLLALDRLAPRVLRRPDRVLEVLAEMRPMAEVGPVGVHEVRAVLADRLTTLEDDRPPHRYGRVFVSTPEGARGRSFRVVFVPGLAERVFPRRPREDPLLLDDVRERLSPELRRQEQRGLEERMLLRVAVGAAEECVVLSYPRVDVAEGRPRVPSFYALDVARATRGRLPDWERLERDAEAEADARLAWPAPRDPDRAIDCAEHDLASLQPLFEKTPDEARGGARYLLEMNEHLARALRSQWARWWKRWYPADGIVRTTEHTEPLLERQRPMRRPFSVTSLERFSYCPYRFFLSAIHRLEPREESMSIVQMDPLTKGSLIHEVQAKTLAALRDDDRLPLRPEEADAVRAILDDTMDAVAKAYQENLAPAIDRVWDDEVESIRADLRVWLRRLAAEAWTPAHFELSFGLRLGDDADPAAVEEPVELDGGWLLRGAIDLVERGEAGLRVTDHKTGAARVQEGAIVGGGESLQPVLYSLAAERVLKQDVVAARLSYCTARGGFQERSVEINEWSRLQGRQVLDVIDRAVQHGRLHPAPREKACRWCDFRPVCGPHEERRVRGKDSGPLEDLRALRQLP